jgi:alkylation response protein AidB-like acyl-CoA dehydrogenase
VITFEWEDAELYARTLGFAKRELAPGSTERVRTGSFDRELWRRAGAFGLPGLPVPQTHGGMGLGAATTAHLLEALGRGSDDAGLVFSLAAHLFACVVPLVRFGSEPQKAELLPRLARGELVGASAISETGAGSDVFALATRAVADGGTYVLDGEKSWVTNGPVADVFLVYARTQPNAGYFSVSAFLVEKDRPGLRVGKPIAKVGLATSPTCSIQLESCRIPEENLVGQLGQGAPVFEHAMLWERSCLFALYLGRMQTALERVVEHAKTRSQFGRALGDFQAVSHRIADMKVRLEAARALLYAACAKLDRDEDARLDVAIAKLFVSEAAVQSGLDTVELFGALGVASDSGIERFLGDALPARTVSGTSDIQRNLIARALGL